MSFLLRFAIIGEFVNFLDVEDNFFLVFIYNYIYY